MARKKRDKSRRPPSKRTKRVPISTKELVVQYRHAGLTYNAIAKKTNLGYSTVENIIKKWAPDNPERVKKARAKALEVMAGQVQEKALEALENITPDSLKHDRVEQYDSKGNLIGVQHSGPNAVQLATMYGILQDKVNAMHDKAAQLRGESTDQIGPDGFKELLASVKGRLTRLTQLNADLDTGQLSAKIVEIEGMIGEEEEDGQMIEADYEVVDGDSV